MHLLSPIWLIGLLPWLATAIYLLRGARESSRVPFLPLWRSTEAQPRTQRTMRPPPAPIALALLAALLGILAAARPSFSRHLTLNTPVVIVIDHGLTMSARGPSGYRFSGTATRVADLLQNHFDDAELKLITVPGGPARTIRLADLPREIQSLTPTACDTTQSLSDVIAAQETSGKSEIVVITDHDVPSGHIIRVTPESTVQDVAITRLSVRQIPTTQAMIELRNQSTRTKTTLRISSGSFQSDHQIDLPTSPQLRPYFFDLPSVTDIVQAQLLEADAIPANDSAWAVLEKTFPRIEPRSPLPPAISRIIQAYAKARPAPSAPASPSSDSSRILLVTDPSALPPTERGAIVLPADNPAQSPILAHDHDITRHVNWQNFSHLKTSAAPPPEGWTPILTSGPNILLAVKPTDPRQAWIAFDADQWQTTTDFVIFWTNVFDFLGDTHSTAFASHPLSDWTPNWKLDIATPAPAGQWPGLYTRPNSQPRAFNAPDTVLAPPPPPTWQSRLVKLSAQTGTIDLSPALFLSALACLLASLALWR